MILLKTCFRGAGVVRPLYFAVKDAAIKLVRRVVEMWKEEVESVSI